MVLAVSLISSVLGNIAWDNSVKTIKSSLRLSGQVQSMCVDNKCCILSSTEDCDFSNFKAYETTLVLPGGKTSCLYGEPSSTPYAFQVIPGASNDKLLFYFQGGGACWDELSTNAGLCTTDASPNSPIGVFDHSNPKNAFKDYTIVHALYCSGDVW